MKKADDPTAKVRMERPCTMGEALRTHHNALNALRLALAFTVVTAHSWPIATGRGGPELFSGALEPGRAAVVGFFVISGYLIAQSRERMGLAPFLWRRFLRLMPAFWVCLIVTAFVAAPIGVVLSGGNWSFNVAARYVSNNAFLQMRLWNVGQTPVNVPFPMVWNGSLWSLFYEGCAYVISGLALTWHLLRKPFGAVALMLFAWASVPLAPIVSSSHLWQWGSQLGAVFATGMALASIAEYVRLSWTFVACGVALLLVGCGLGGWTGLHTLGALGMGITLLQLGAILPVRWGARNDVSYGIYIYGFVVQELLAAAGVRSIPLMIVSASILVVPVAWTSWLLVERPAMRLRHLVPSESDKVKRRGLRH